MSRFLAILMTVFGCGLLAAGELQPDVRQALIKLHNETMAKGDWWTALQCEAYGVRYGVRMTPVLGSSEVLGDPLFAFPDDFIQVHDAGDHVIAVTPFACYVIAPDGRPLRPSIRFTVEESEARVSWDHTWLAVCNNDRPIPNAGPPNPLAQAKQAHIVVYNLINGTEKWRVPLDFQTLYPVRIAQCAVASDGSAVAISLNSPELLTFIARANGEKELLRGFSNPRAVGPNGQWLIATQRTADGRTTLVLHVGKANHPIRESCAAGADGMAIVMLSPEQAKLAGVPVAKGSLTAAALVNATGKLIPYQFSLALGQAPSIVTLDGHLLLNSGLGAEAPPEVDMLGVETKNPGKQPASFAIYRWSDIKDTPGIPPTPVLSQPQPASECSFMASAIMTWNDKELSVWDLTQNNMTSRVLGTYDQPILAASEDDMRLLIRHKSGSTIADISGTPLWYGEGEIRMQGPNWLLNVTTKDGHRQWAALRLDVPPAQRLPKAIQFKQPISWATIDGFGRFGQVCNSVDSSVIMFNPTDGVTKPLIPIPPAINRQSFPGRFCHLFGRLYDKASPTPDGNRQQWLVRDALLLGQGNALILDRLGQFWAGKRNGPFSLVGTLANATRIINGHTELLLANGYTQVLAKVVSGPKLAPVPIGNVPEESSGPWRLDASAKTFYVRGFQTMRWSVERNGFSPLAMHSPPSGNLVVVTPSLVLGLEPGMARFIGIPVR